MKRRSSWSSAFSRLSVSQKLDDDAENDCVSAAGDIGDRAINGGRHSESGGFRLSSLDITPHHGNGAIYNPGDHELQHPAAVLNCTYTVNQSEQLPTHVSTNGKVNPEETKKLQELDNKTRYPSYWTMFHV